MKIAIVGTGYVGLVSGACFAEMGTDVVCVDTDAQKIRGLQQGIIPIYEPGLEEMVKRNQSADRLQFTTDLESVMDGLDIIFCAVGTPAADDGSTDLSYVMQVAATIGRLLKHYVLVVTKSTVPVGTSELIRAAIRKELDKRGVDLPFDVASNPEFLKEGAAIKDFMSPDRVVVGVDSEHAKKIMSTLYHPFLLNNFRVIFMDIPSAEMTKYAANAMLATRISFMNDIANLCEVVGADVNMVRKGIGTDARIGGKFLYPGCGYGGSCFPKDIKSLIKTAENNGYSMRVLKAVEQVNDDQKKVLFGKLMRYFNGHIQGKRIAIWGLTFKPETDDIREAPSLVLIDQILAAGGKVIAYDPVAMTEARRRLNDAVEYAENIYRAVEEADALIVVTEWKQFRLPSWDVIKSRMRTPVVFDGRNIYEKADLSEYGFDYYAIGK
ncbi:MAG: UDP-glucose/GDP-mannose dehydrogenase family protein [Dysgonamonadaceae bacterium]|jgi:UDPglucose 6-dehydrogenase|nr:UDP-glucose/GDP-mannose dehydrogenase family protein [Dysgonamonadaceae bacterium]